MSLAVLRQQLAAVVAGTPSSTPGLPTGFAALDTILPGGGIPRGRLTELLAPAGAGKTTIARALVAATIRRGGGVAWIDATRTLDPRDFAPAVATYPGVVAQQGRSPWATTSIGGTPHGTLTAAELEALWVVRPTDPARASWCADLLLRSSAFTLVVLDGAPVLPRAVGVRLAQLARESDAALLLLGEGTRASEIGGALRLRLTPDARSVETRTVETRTVDSRIVDSRSIDKPSAVISRPAPRPAMQRITVTLEKGGPYQHVQVEVNRGHGITRRLCAHPEIPDRRGVARSRKHTAPRSHRAAQPDYPAQHGAS